jgi:hypothetical protein
MKDQKRYLTKSRFKIGHECPTKLHYLDDKKYGNNNTDNTFLQALAEGGFQVGELAKLYHPGGFEITEVDKAKAVAQTSDLLTRKEVTIYEGAFQFNDLFIRADVVVKNGNDVQLIEVKAKSFDKADEHPFYNKSSLKKGDFKLNSEWEPYLIDVAFQAHVLGKAHPKVKVTSYLLLADKTAVATEDGINQKFFLEKSDNGRVKAKVAAGTTLESVGAPLLVKICVDKEVQVINASRFDEGKTFEELISDLAEICVSGRFVDPVVGSHCKSCEFRIKTSPSMSGLKSGFAKCWSTVSGVSESACEKPFAFDVWNFRKASKLIADGRIWMAEIEREDISPTTNKDSRGLSSSERQWLQVEKVRANDLTSYFDAPGLHEEMKSWKFPLHFIDFETSLVAIPFHKGRRPYEQIAFQFSHHVLTEDGTLKHADQYINTKRGHFPNFDFVRALRECLSKDSGTIFRYATHENTVLCQIRDQLKKANDVKDRHELIAFIESITESQRDSDETWCGPRTMVDMCELVKRFYYHPATGGSNSIKKVLPAILNDSSYLQKLYSLPIYGSDKIVSLNLKEWIWIKKDDLGRVADPYKLLPPVFSDLDIETMDSLITDGSIADGGAAMTAYSRMQFTQMSNEETNLVAQALLKYCELDTLAMVMIYQHWKNEIEHQLQKVA